MHVILHETAKETVLFSLHLDFQTPDADHPVQRCVRRP